MKFPSEGHAITGGAFALNPDLLQTEAPPVMAAARWVAGRDFGTQKPLVLLSQAAPADPPPLPLRQAMAEAVIDDAQAHFYAPVLGQGALRDEVALRWQAIYGGAIARDQIAITAGCNQAFCAAMAALAQAGDEVILISPWYFNHKMWLDMTGVRAKILPVGADLLPDPDAARASVTPRTRAIVLVSPNNPCGVEYPPALIHAFAQLARDAGIALILDETYRDFSHQTARPHDLFADPDWDEVLVHLYSFSKSYRLTGHRVGAIAAHPRILAQVEKYLDTVAICAPALGQIAALWGLRHLGPWLADERAEIIARNHALKSAMAALPQWELVGSGAYFAWVKHPFALPSDQVARALVDQAHILALPGTMFTPAGDVMGAGHLRLAFANLPSDQIAPVLARLDDVTLPLARAGLSA